jgi:hydroxyacylglutathione hydrolase
MVLCTHKHADHSGGNVVFKQRFPELEVIGTKYEPIAGLTKPVAGMVHVS